MEEKHTWSRNIHGEEIYTAIRYTRQGDTWNWVIYGQEIYMKMGYTWRRDIYGMEKHIRRKHT